MNPLIVVVLCSSFWQVSESIDLKFPPNFKFGAATSSYQIEGGWDADGKGENVWDRLCHENPGKIKNNASGDIAADSYHKWREDVRIAAELGLDFYRFSINWARILPNGFSNKINKAGAKYYSDLIDALLAEGIEPIITLYHWEMPVKIQDMGGWTNPLIVDWFGDYARVVFSLYADRIKTWLTINEGAITCDFGYNSGFLPPNVKETEFAPFLCNKHVLLAHAKAYRIFDQEFRPKYKGGWPPSIEKIMLKNSLERGFKVSRLPSFTEEEKEFVKGTADFYGMNHYTTYLIRSAKPGEDNDFWFINGSPELNAVLVHPPDTHYGFSNLLPIYPEGFRKQMAWLKKQYGDIDIFITENGFSTNDSRLDDYDRVDFYKKYLEQVLLSIKVDNVSVIGYSAWSLIDNFEWTDGYVSKFGLYQVDFKDPNRKRIPRTSAHFYACVIKNRYLNDICLKIN